MLRPLDAARRLAEQRHWDSPGGDGHCILCGRPEAHAFDCPVLTLPRIVAALEAAESYLAPGIEGGGSLARLLALVAALKGE